MKTTCILLVTIFTLQINFLFAGNDGASIVSGSSLLAKNAITLAPSTPTEATFEDVATATAFSLLAPKTPADATFEDEAGEVPIPNLAPVTPAEADFEELN